MSQTPYHNTWSNSNLSTATSITWTTNCLGEFQETDECIRIRGKLVASHHAYTRGYFVWRIQIAGWTLGWAKRWKATERESERQLTT